MKSGISRSRLFREEVMSSLEMCESVRVFGEPITLAPMATFSMPDFLSTHVGWIRADERFRHHFDAYTRKGIPGVTVRLYRPDPVAASVNDLTARRQMVGEHVRRAELDPAQLMNLIHLLAVSQSDSPFRPPHPWYLVGYLRKEGQLLGVESTVQNVTPTQSYCQISLRKCADELTWSGSRRLFSTRMR